MLTSPRGGTDGQPAGGGRSGRAGGGSGRPRRLDPDVDVREADVCRFGPHGCVHALPCGRPCRTCWAGACSAKLNLHSQIEQSSVAWPTF